MSGPTLSLSGRSILSKRSSTLTVIALAIATAVLAYCTWLEPIFAANDDVGLAMVGSGFGMAIHPQAHLIFSNYGYGLLLGVFGRVIGPTAHGWITLVSLAACLFLLLRAQLSAGKDLFNAMSWIAILICLFVAQLVGPQFTMTATVLFASAIACTLVTDWRSHRPILSYVSVCCALAMGFLIRPESFLMGAIVTAPLLGFLSWTDNAQRWTARILCAAIVLIICSGYAGNHLAYAGSPEWSNAIQYNFFRSEFSDFGRVPWIDGPSVYRGAGWTRNDYDMFMNYYTLAPTFDLNRIYLIVSKIALPAYAFRWSWLLDWFAYPSRSRPLLFIMLSQFGVFIAAKGSRRCFLLLFLGECAAVCMAAATGRVPLERVWLGIVYTALIVGGAIYFGSPPSDNRRAWHSVFALLAVFFAGWAMTDSIEAHRDELAAAQRYRSWIEANRGFFSGTIVSWGSGLEVEHLVEPTRVYFPLPQTRFIAIADMSKTPIVADTIAAAGITDFSRSLCTDPSLRLIAPNDVMGYLVQFCREHENTVPFYRQVSTLGNKSLFKLAKRENVP